MFESVSLANDIAWPLLFHCQQSLHTACWWGWQCSDFSHEILSTMKMWFWFFRMTFGEDCQWLRWRHIALQSKTWHCCNHKDLGFAENGMAKMMKAKTCDTCAWSETRGWSAMILTWKRSKNRKQGATGKVELITLNCSWQTQAKNCHHFVGSLECPIFPFTDPGASLSFSGGQSWSSSFVELVHLLHHVDDFKTFMSMHAMKSFATRKILDATEKTCLFQWGLHNDSRNKSWVVHLFLIALCSFLLLL